MWEKQRVWKSKLERKILGKTSRIAIEMKIKTNSQRLYFSLNFPTLFKTNKDQIFWHKNSFKTLLKDVKFCSWNSYVKQPRNGVFIAPKQIYLLAAGKGSFALPVDCPVDRPNGQISDRCASSRPGLDTESSSSLPVDRGHFQRAELSGRSTARSTGPLALVVCTSCARRRPVRLTGRQPGPTL